MAFFGIFCKFWYSITTILSIFIHIAMKLIVLIFVLIMFIVGCSSSPDKINNSGFEVTESWSIPKEDIIGPYSPFPLVTSSSFVNINQVNYTNNHLVALVSLDSDELRAYPNSFIGKYEIINDQYQNQKFAITHCPLTGSTTCWDRIIDGNIITIKASGYLYNDNVMPTDIETGSIWSQMLMRGVTGVYDLAFHETYNLIETDWRTVKELFPYAKIYNEIVDENQIPIEDPNTEPTNREYYRYGILSGAVKPNIHIFKYNLFDTDNDNELILIETNVQGRRTLVIGNESRNFVTSYFVNSDREYFVNDPNSFQFNDSLGNVYNAVGLVIEGPDKDLQLQSPKAYTATWVAWQDFFENFTEY